MKRLRRTVSAILVLVLVLSAAPVTAGASDIFYCDLNVRCGAGDSTLKTLWHAGIWYAEAQGLADLRGCSFNYNSNNGAGRFYLQPSANSITILATFPDDTLFSRDGIYYVPLQEASCRIGVYFYENGQGLYVDALRTPAEFIDYVEDLFLSQQMALRTLILELGEVGVLLASTGSIGFGLLGDFSLTGLVGGITGELQQDLCDSAMSEMLHVGGGLKESLDKRLNTEELLNDSAEFLEFLALAMETNGPVYNFLKNYGVDTDTLAGLFGDQGISPYSTDFDVFLKEYAELSGDVDIEGILEAAAYFSSVADTQAALLLAAKAGFDNSSNERVRTAARRLVDLSEGKDSALRDFARGHVKSVLLDKLFDTAIETIDPSVAGWEKAVSKLTFKLLFDKPLELSEKADFWNHYLIFIDMQNALWDSFQALRVDGSNAEDMMLARAFAIAYAKTGLAAYEKLDFDKSLANARKNAMLAYGNAIEELLSYSEMEYLPDYDNACVIARLEAMRDADQNESAPPADGVKPELGGDNAALKKFFYEQHNSEELLSYVDLAVFADVSRDGKDELIYLESDDDFLFDGYIYTERAGQITQLEYFSGGCGHAAGFINLHLKEADIGYSIQKSDENMWQGIGWSSYTQYYYDENGEQVVEAQAFVDSETPGNGDEEGMVTDEAWARYWNERAGIKAGSFALVDGEANLNPPPINMEEIPSHLIWDFRSEWSGDLSQGLDGGSAPEFESGNDALKEFFYEQHNSEERLSLVQLTVFADVSKDGKDELIYLESEDGYFFTGYIYTDRGGQITQLEHFIGGCDHASMFINLYLKEMDIGYSILHTDHGMWQGMGCHSLTQYYYNESGEPVVEAYACADSEIPGNSDSMGMITDEAWDSYCEESAGIMAGSFALIDGYVDMVQPINTENIPSHLIWDFWSEWPGGKNTDSNQNAWEEDSWEDDTWEDDAWEDDAWVDDDAFQEDDSWEVNDQGSDGYISSFPTEIEVFGNNGSTKYVTVQVCSTARYEYAISGVEKLRANGFNGFIFKREGDKYYKLAVGVFDRKTDAETLINMIRTGPAIRGLSTESAYAVNVWLDDDAAYTYSNWSYYG